LKRHLAKPHHHLVVGQTIDLQRLTFATDVDTLSFMAEPTG